MDRKHLDQLTKWQLNFFYSSWSDGCDMVLYVILSWNSLLHYQCAVRLFHCW